MKVSRRLDIQDIAAAVRLYSDAPSAEVRFLVTTDGNALKELVAVVESDLSPTQTPAGQQAASVIVKP